MASVKATKNRTFRIEICVNGVRDSGTFDTKAQAKAWAELRKTELRGQAATGIEAGHTVGHALSRYSCEQSPKKEGCKFEQLRLNALARVELELDVGSGGRKIRVRFDSIKLTEFNSTHYAALRDARLKEVASSTVNREMNLLSHVFSIARKEWKWIAESPTKDVSRPKDPPPRVRRISATEIESVCFSLNYDGGLAQSLMQRAAIAFLFGIETAMRAGEICKILRINPAEARSYAKKTGVPSVSYLKRPDVAFLSKTKNGDAREVPLSPRAIELISFLPMAGANLFGLTRWQLDANFRKGRDRSGVEDLHFHDTRHEAISRLAKKYHPIDLARIVGHRDLNELLTYYHPDIDDLVKALA